MKLNLIIILFLFFIACNPNQKKRETIIIKGSDTMVNLTRLWAEKYMENKPDVSIQINGGGSGTGIASLLNGTANIANISRELNISEIENANRLNIVPTKNIVALDAIAVIVNPENKVDSLTIEQLRDIFSGKITNWKFVGGIDKEISLFGRENSSGTYEFMKEYVLHDKIKKVFYDFAPSTQVLQGTAALTVSIRKDQHAIGYGSLGYFAKKRGVKILKIVNDLTGLSVNLMKNNNIDYSVIWSGKYPLSRYLYCYTDGKANKEVNEFIRFVTSEAGQKIIMDMEYIPLPSIN